MKPIHIAALLALVVTLSACSAQSSPAGNAVAQAPELEVTTTDGRQMSLAQNIEADKPTVVYFMASWCPKCAQNWEALNEVYPEYESEVDFVAISIDPTDTDDVLSQLAAEKGFVFDTVAGDPDLVRRFNVREQTEKFAIDRDGNIVATHKGVFSEDEWAAFFEQVA